MIATPDISDWVTYEDSEHGFRLRYPPSFIYGSSGASGMEILRDTVFYNPSEYNPGVSTEFNAIGVEVLANPEKFDSVQAWADAHAIDAPDTGIRELQFESYRIIRSFPVNEQEATLFTTQSVAGITVYNIILPLSDFNTFALFYYYENIDEIEPIGITMAATLEEIQ